MNCMPQSRARLPPGSTRIVASELSLKACQCPSAAHVTAAYFSLRKQLRGGRNRPYGCVVTADRRQAAEVQPRRMLVRVQTASVMQPQVLGLTRPGECDVSAFRRDPALPPRRRLSRRMP